MAGGPSTTLAEPAGRRGRRARRGRRPRPLGVRPPRGRLDLRRRRPARAPTPGERDAARGAPRPDADDPLHDHSGARRRIGILPAHGTARSSRCRSSTPRDHLAAFFGTRSLGAGAYRAALLGRRRGRSRPARRSGCCRAAPARASRRPRAASPRASRSACAGATRPATSSTGSGSSAPARSTSTTTSASATSARCRTAG